MDQNPARLLKILMVEDEDDHALLIERFFQRSKSHNKIYRVNDGQEAIDYIFKQGNFAAVETPDLILLDLKLPKVSGFEVLTCVKNNSATRNTPVVVLSSSGAENDRSKAYQEGANSYLIKPADMNQFQEMINSLANYWGVLNAPSAKAN